jgi:hypothetical protein
MRRFLARLKNCRIRWGQTQNSNASPQIDRDLTTAGNGTRAEKLDRVRQWRAAALPEIELVIGGRTDAETIRLLKPIGSREFAWGRRCVRAQATGVQL